MTNREEINACSVKIKVDIDGEDRGLAAACLRTRRTTTRPRSSRSAARRPVSAARSAIRFPAARYVYQAMRVTGAADPRGAVSETLPGKLPQRKIRHDGGCGLQPPTATRSALRPGMVDELYHRGLCRQAPGDRRGHRRGAGGKCRAARRPHPGDVIILLGGRTGRDGCGGATGSSKAHTRNRLTTCGAEVQKGNPPEERKLQRLFRNAEVTPPDQALQRLRRGRRFGRDRRACRRSRYRPRRRCRRSMTALTAPSLPSANRRSAWRSSSPKEDADKFLDRAGDEENLEATVVAAVTDEPRAGACSWRRQEDCRPFPRVSEFQRRDQAHRVIDGTGERKTHVVAATGPFDSRRKDLTKIMAATSTSAPSAACPTGSTRPSARAPW